MASDATAPLDVIVVGAGFAGLYALHKLRGLGFTVQGYEIGDDVGGTWYWNRYPGARCDVESVDYSYSFDPALEQEWRWTERFATQPEILRYLSHVADRFALRSLIQFDTRVTDCCWDATSAIWTVRTERGISARSRFVILATGSLSAAKAPDIEGVDDFAGQRVSTSNWPRGGIDLRGKRVGVIGTGSSAIQTIPIVAQEADHVTVFQRTAAFSLPARNAPLSDAYISDLKHRYAAHRQESRAQRSCSILPGTGVPALSLTPEEREAGYAAAWARGGPSYNSTFTDTLIDPQANAHAADFVRARIHEIVNDPETAETLSPRDYPIASKRVAIDTDYYATFNRSNVTLIDLRKTPLRRIVPEGVETSAGVIPLDTLVLATGFDAMTGSFLRSGVRTRKGATLVDAWAAGPRTYLGLLVSGFPNLFLVAGPGSPSVLSNMVCSIEQHVDWISALLVTMRANAQGSVEADPKAEEAWVARVNDAAAGTLYLSGNSWYLGANVPGKPRVFMPFIGGVPLYREICEDVAASGYRGLRFDRQPEA